MTALSKSNLLNATLMALLSFSALPAHAETDARQILLPVGDVAADAGWVLYSGDEGYARTLQDQTADLAFHDALKSAALVNPGSIGSALTVRLKSGAPPQGNRSGDHIIHVWARAAQASGATFRVMLLQGETPVWASSNVTASANFSEKTLTVPQSAALAITDYQDLRLRFISQGRSFFITKAYLEAAEDQAPDLAYPDSRVFEETVSFVQFELDPLATGVSWFEDTAPGDAAVYTAYCSALDQETGKPVPVGNERGVSMGPSITEAAPQVGRTSKGPVAVTRDPEGYLVTCDINEDDPAASVVTRWAGPDLDPWEDNPTRRSYRASTFMTKDYSQPDRIVVYQLRDPLDDGAEELWVVNLDKNPLKHVRIWNPPAQPPGRIEPLILSTQRTLDGTPYWFWGCFLSSEPGTPLSICRMNMEEPGWEVKPIISRPEDVLYGWPFIGDDGKQRWIAGFNPEGTTGGQGDPGLRLYVEAEPLWEVEDDYSINTDLWAPSFAIPARGQTPEVVGPDDQGRRFVVFSTHDVQDSPGPFALGSYAKIVAAEIGRPGTTVVVSRKQNHQSQTEPEPYILNGKLRVVYTETENGPIYNYGEGILQQRLIDLSDFPPW